jgi:hypothetical protein
MFFKYCNLWHTGIMFLLFLFIGWIYEYYKIKLFNIFMLLVSVIQVYWSIDTSIYDYKESYTPAKEVADFIKKYDYKNMNIYGVEFYESAINAYFDENIFDNWHDTRFFYWSKNNIYYKIPLDVDSLLRENVDMIIVTPLYEDVDFSGLEKYYDVYYFSASTGKELTDDAVFAAFDMTPVEGTEMIKKAMEANFSMAEKINGVEDPFFLEQKDKTLSEGNLKLVRPLIAENGELQFVGEFYSLAGADSYMHRFNSKGEWLEMYCHAHS